jgi:hypothetical protein
LENNSAKENEIEIRRENQDLNLIESIEHDQELNKNDDDDNDDCDYDEDDDEDEE